MRLFFCCLFGCLIPALSWAQTPKVDSLRRVVETTKVDSVRGRMLCRLCGELNKIGQLAEALETGQEGLALCQQTGDRKGEGGCLNNLGVTYLHRGNYGLALEHFKQSLQIKEEIGDNRSGIANNLVNIGVIYLNQGDYPRAIEYVQRSLQIRQAIGDRAGVAGSLGNIGTIHLNQGDFPKALEYYQQCRKIFEELGDQIGVANSTRIIGEIYQNQGNYHKALEQFHQSLKISEKISDHIGIVSSYQFIGSVFESQGDNIRALEYYHKSLTKSEEIGSSTSIASALGNLANIYSAQKDHARALDYYRRCLQIQVEMGERPGEASTYLNLGETLLTQKDYSGALEYFQRGLQIFEEINDLARTAAGYNYLARAHIDLGKFKTAREFAEKSLKLATAVGHLDYKQAGARSLYRADSALGNWKSAFEHARLYHIYSDSMKNDAQSRELGRLEARYEADKEREILEAQQQAQLQQRNWMLGSATGGAFLLLIIAFTLFRSRRKEKKANAHLRALNEEIQQQKAEIEAQNSEIIAQRDQLNDSHQRLVSLDRMKDELTGMIVHDLKNPLNAVLAMAALPPDARRLQTIRGAGQQMSQLVLNLLDVQKYEQAALVLKPETAPAGELLHRAADQTGFLAEQKQIQFRIEANPTLHVEADTELIVRVLVNLLTNAIKYTPPGDTIEIEARDDATHGAIFRVTDHGKGIPAEQLEQVFEKFSQVDGGRASGKLRSTGLGLTFCRLTVEAHGGSIGVQSEMGRFTTFEFNLPKALIADRRWAAAPSAESLAPEPLPTDLQAEHADILSKLRELAPYNLSDIFELLERLPDAPPHLATWKTAVEAAALAGNEERYRELLG